MQLRQTFRKTKLFFNKSFRNFLSFFFEEYQKLPRSFSFNPFLCRVGNARTRTSDQFYSEFYDLLQTDLNRINLYGNNNRSGSAMEAASCTESSVCFPRQRLQKSKNEERAQEKKKGSSQLRKKEDFNAENMNKKVHVLAQKMKAMDMVDAGDLERVLDIEEALHYYSRLKSPVYVDIVDTFFHEHAIRVICFAAMCQQHQTLQGKAWSNPVQIRFPVSHIANLTAYRELMRV